MELIKKEGSDSQITSYAVVVHSHINSGKGIIYIITKSYKYVWNGISEATFLT